MREPSGSFPRAIGPLDPVMPSPRESSTSGPRPRVAPLDPDLPPAGADPALTARVTETITRPKKKRPGSGAMAVAVACGVAIVGVIAVSLLPTVAAQSTVSFAAPVPDMVGMWGGAAQAPLAQSYVTRVASSVAAKAPAVGTVSVTVAQEPAAHAVALPGREIVVSAGLLRRLSSEAQLAGVLAHLIAHMETAEIDRAYLDAQDPDARTRARLAGTTPFSVESERRAAERTAELLRDTGYITAGFVDAHAALSARSGRMSAFVQQHRVPPEALEMIRQFATGGRSADADYARNTLDPLGRAAAPAPERSINPPLPPKPPPTPKLDFSRPSDRKIRDGVAPPTRTSVRSEPPTPPL